MSSVKQLTSDELEKFLDFTKDVVSNYKYHESELKDQEAIQQDLLHKFELERLTTNEKCKAATQMAKCRKKRRKHKDVLEELKPLYDWLSDEKNKRAINTLKEVLGKVRAAERRHVNRHYNQRSGRTDGHAKN